MLGVKGIYNLIMVKPVAKPTDVQQKIQSALRRHAGLDAQRLNVTVSGDTVKLAGVVHSYAEIKEVEKAALTAPGICKVDNELVVSN